MQLGNPVLEGTPSFVRENQVSHKSTLLSFFAQTSVSELVEHIDGKVAGPHPSGRESAWNKGPHTYA